MDNESLDAIAERIKREAAEVRREGSEPEPKRKKARTKSKAEPAPAVESGSLAHMLTQAFHVAGTLAVDHLALAPPFSREQARVLAEAWQPVLTYYMGESDNPVWDALIVSAIVGAPYAYQYATRQEVETAETGSDDAQSEHIDRGAAGRGENDIRALSTVPDAESVDH